MAYIISELSYEKITLF